jgi:PEGA domain-containing protein
MKKHCVVAISLLLCIATGCSLFKSSTQVIKVDTDPPHAQIWINRSYVGEAPIEQKVRRNISVDVTVKMDGYETVQRVVGHHLNFTGVLDVIGAWLIILPLFGALAAGANSLDEQEVFIRLGPHSIAAAASTNAPADTK